VGVGGWFWESPFPGAGLRSKTGKKRGEKIKDNLEEKGVRLEGDRKVDCCRDRLSAWAAGSAKKNKEKRET